MKNNKPSIKLNNNLSLNTKLSQEYDLLCQRLNETMNPDLKIELSEFLKSGLVSESLESLFKDRDYMSLDYHSRGRDNFELKFALMTLRYSFVEQYGFVLLNQKLIDTASKFLKNKKVCEIGAGTGWLSYNLQQQGIDVTPIDYKPGQDSNYGFKKLHTDILMYNGVDYLEQHMPEVVLLSWPDYDTSFAFEILEKMTKGQTLIYIGEGYGGCTGNDQFFDLLEQKTNLNNSVTELLQESALCWTGVHDTWYVYEVK